jgi:hypothetical protein
VIVAAPILDRRALNRATLARQLLLERQDRTVPDALTHLVAMQAQEPQEPYVGLWSRLDGFDPRVLSAMVEDRSAVRLHLMRRTVHLVTAGDALRFRGAHDVMLRQRLLGVYGKELADVDLAHLARLGQPLVTPEPRTLPDAGRVLAAHWPDVAPRALGDALTVALALVQVPPRGLWRVAGPAAHTTVAAWLGREPDPSSPEVLAEMIRRYLAAYGPAASADVRAWCGLAGLPDVIRTLRPELVTARDEHGRELLDLPDAPRPDPDTPAPPRFLPAFDNAVLGYDDRSRIIDDAHRGLSVSGTRFVLVDGRVAATWEVKEGMLDVLPLVRVSRAERSAVIAEGHRLLTFLGDGVDGKVRMGALARS